ncbi:MAG: N-acetylmuramoyl-L-alanine amidase [Myxococcota bacterium]
MLGFGGGVLVTGAVAAVAVLGLGVAAQQGALPFATVADPEGPPPALDPAPRPVPPGPDGPLAGLVVYVSAGHGLLLHRVNHDGDPIAWGLQRSPRYGMVEDDWTARFVADDLAPALEAAGATVIAMRERDTNPEAVVVDDGYEGFASYGAREVVPDELAEGGLSTVLAPGGSASWRLTVPETGHWYLYTRWSEADEQDPQAIYTVTTGADSRTVVVDQRGHGGHWWPLGDDCLEGGSEVEVTLTGSGPYPLSADAVRLGGGTFDIVQPWNLAVQSAPWWRVSFTHQVERLGGPDWISTYECGRHVSDMRLRPHWASWAAESDDDAVYLSIHTNASPRGRPQGLTTFYGVDSNPPTPADPESVRLATLMHQHLYATVHAQDKGYRSRGTRPGDYSEISPVHNTLPSALFEMGFHDNPEEAQKRLQSPLYRKNAAKGLVEGLVDWRSSRAGPPVPPVARDPDRSWSRAE